MRIGTLVLLGLSACASIDASDGWLPPTEPPKAAAGVPDAQILDAPDGVDSQGNPVHANPDDASHGVDSQGNPVHADDDHGGAVDSQGNPVPTPDDGPVEPEAPATPDDASALLAAAMGTTLADAPEDAQALDDAPGWMPERATAPAWGVRLVSTLPDTQPPRAVLALGQGGEIVVAPGQMVPEAKIVVLAIGRDAVQVAHIRPQGDHATVETSILRPFYASKPTVEGGR